MGRETMPALRTADGDGESSYVLSRRRREAAFRLQVEMYVAWARELLDATPAVIDSPRIRERQVEAASAVLDVLWAVIAEHNAVEGEPTPLPGLIWHKFPAELRRLPRLSAP